MNRRDALKLAGAASAMMMPSLPISASVGNTRADKRTAHPLPFVSAKDGTRLYVQDWGSGQPIVFVSAWTLNSEFWGTHLHAVSAAGYRAVAIDRRGHGRSDAPSHGYDADTLAEDLAAVLDSLDLHDAILVTHSMGAGEAVRYLKRHGAGRVSKLVLVAPTTPYLVKTQDNPDAVPQEALDGMLGIIAGNFPQWVRDNEQPFFVAQTDSETRNWIKAMMLSVPLPVAIAFRQFSGQTDFRSDLASIDIPALVLHGDQDASAPLQLTGEKTVRLLRNGKLVIYENAPHGLPLTHRERFLQDLLAFART